MLDRIAQCEPLLAADAVHFEPCRDAGSLDHDRDELLRQESVERVRKIAVDVLRKITQKPLIELFRRETRLEIELQPAGGNVLRQMSARRQHERPRYAEMRKKQLPLFPVQDLIGAEKRQTDVSQRKSLHPGAVLLRLKRHERRACRNDGVAKSFGDAVAVAGGAGRRIR